MQGHGDEAGSKVKGPLRKDARSHRRYFSQVGQGSAPGGTWHNVTALSLRCFGKNVTDAKLEKTSLSADVFLGVPFVTGPPCATLAGVGVNSNPQARYGKKNSFSYYTNRTFSCIMKWLGQDICLSHRKET